MRKRFLSLGLILCMLFGFSGCSSNNTDTDSKNKLRVGVTISPLQDFAEAIGGDKVEVFSIIPDGSDAHSFDPKPKDLKNLLETDIFVYNGLGMEEWIDSILTTIENEDIKIVEAANGVEVIDIQEEHDHSEEAVETVEEHNHDEATESTDDHNHEEEATESSEEHSHDEEEATETAEEDSHEHGEECTHTHTGVDPHIWLSLDNAIIEAENIKNALVEVDPENEAYYQENFDKLKSDFTELNNEYKDKFKEVTNKSFVTGHAAFGYLCKEYGLTQNSIADVFGEGELTAKNLEALISYCKENNVKTIFSEAVASSKEAETLANEVGANVVKVYSLETREDNLTYLEGMKYNLETIYNSLK